MAQLLLQDAFQGSPLWWDYGEGSHIFLLAKSQTTPPPPHSPLPTTPLPTPPPLPFAWTRTVEKTSGRVGRSAGKGRASKSRWHIRVMPNSAESLLSAAKATRSVTSAAAAAEGELVSRWLLPPVIAVTVRTLPLCDTARTRTYVHNCSLALGYFFFFFSQLPLQKASEESVQRKHSRGFLAWRD